MIHSSLPQAFQWREIHGLLSFPFAHSRKASPCLHKQNHVLYRSLFRRSSLLCRRNHAQWVETEQERYWHPVSPTSSKISRNCSSDHAFLYFLELDDVDPCSQLHMLHNFVQRADVGAHMVNLQLRNDNINILSLLNSSSSMASIPSMGSISHQLGTRSQRRAHPCSLHVSLKI